MMHKSLSNHHLPAAYHAAPARVCRELCPGNGVKVVSVAKPHPRPHVHLEFLALVDDGSCFLVASGAPWLMSEGVADAQEPDRVREFVLLQHVAERLHGQERLDASS
eukprot:399171-Hanusia_phi.AAC.3